MYTSLEQIGLTVGSETIDTIMSALPGGSYFICGISTINAGIYPITSGGTLIVEKSFTNRALFRFISAYGTEKRIWYGAHNSGTWSGWNDATAYLPLTGGTLTGMLALVHKLGIMHNGVQTGSIENWGSETIVTAAENASAERHYISIGNPAAGALRANTLMLYHLKDGVYTKKAIFGEHNITCGTTALTAGSSALTTGCIYEMYE